jgi:hypothetical protein
MGCFGPGQAFLVVVGISEFRDTGEMVVNSILK